MRADGRHGNADSGMISGAMLAAAGAAGAAATGAAAAATGAAEVGADGSRPASGVPAGINDAKAPGTDVRMFCGAASGAAAAAGAAGA